MSGGVDDVAGQLAGVTLRPITGLGWWHVNDSLNSDHARSRLDRLTWEFKTGLYLNSGPSGTTA